MSLGAIVEHPVPPAPRTPRLPTLRYAALLARDLGRALLRRAVRGPERPAWTLRTELLVAATRTTLACSLRFGFPWLRGVEALRPALSASRAGVRFASARVAGLPAEWCVPPGADETTPWIVYFHGGGYVAGGFRAHREPIARLAAGTGARVLAIAYRLAPEHPFPAAQEDCLAAARFALASAPGGRVVLAGDSAGGALCVATLTSLRDAGERLPRAALLLSPWVDPLAEGRSMAANARFDIGDRALLLAYVRAFLGDAHPADPRLRVLGADLRGLPPLRIHVGGCEVLLDQVRAFHAAARAAGVDVVLAEYEDMFHGFEGFPTVVPQAQRGLADACVFLRRRLAPVEISGGA